MKRFGVLLTITIMIISVMTGPLVGAIDESAKDELNGDVVPELYIKAINPGYVVDGKSNVGEMIEIGRKSSDDLISLAGVTVRYTNSSGNTSLLLEFPENSFIVGETVLLRLASSPGSELANLNYSKTLAMKGGIALYRGDELLDTVCWTGKDECYKEFMSSHPTTLVRNMSTGDYEHFDEYIPSYVSEWYKAESAKEEEGYGSVASQCRELKFSELLSYYETSKSEQFIELYNTGAEQILLDGCQIRYKNKNYGLSGIVKSDEYFVYYPTEFSLTKNPVNGNVLELVDVDGSKVDSIMYPNGQRKGTSYAWIGYDEKGEMIWKVTYAPTPGAPNNYQEFKTCEVGKVLNEVTGNCVKVTSVTTKICPAGQYLNILTGRCKKYTVASEKKCKEGYYLNEETGRCRKIVENNSADYSLQPEEYEEKSSFVALYVVLGVIGVGLVYLVYEFRREIVKLWRKVWIRFR